MPDYPCSKAATITWDDPPDISFSDANLPGKRTFVVTWKYHVKCNGGCVAGDIGCFGSGDKEVPVPVPIVGCLTSGPLINDPVTAELLSTCFFFFDNRTWEECLEKYGNGSKPANVIKAACVEASRPKPEGCWCWRSGRSGQNEPEPSFIEQKRISNKSCKNDTTYSWTGPRLDIGSISSPIIQAWWTVTPLCPTTDCDDPDKRCVSPGPYETNVHIDLRDPSQRNPNIPRGKWRDYGRCLSAGFTAAECMDTIFPGVKPEDLINPGNIPPPVYFKPCGCKGTL